MTTSALLTMIIVQVGVAITTGYFFYRVLTTPPKPEPDSYEENDGEVR
jgi:hypothetical protein